MDIIPKIHRPRLVIIAGPSGSGKSSLVNRLMADLGKDKIGFSISHTTRDPRPEEQEGVHYHFVMEEEFEKSLLNEEFVEHSECCGHRYGTSKRAIVSVLETGKVCLICLDMEGLKTLKKTDLKPVCIWIDTPSYEELERRIMERNSFNADDVFEQLVTAKREQAFGEIFGQFDHMITNDDLETAYAELKDIIEKVADCAG